MIDKQFTITMICFVQKSSGGVAFGFAFEPFAFFVLGAQGGFHRADDYGGDFADGEAAFLAGLFAFGVDDLGVGGDEFYAVAVHYEQAKVEADLRGGEPDALGVVHRVEHVRAELGQLDVELGDGLAHLAEDLFGIIRDLSNGHKKLATNYTDRTNELNSDPCDRCNSW